jgi:hypothetical protein
MYWGKVTIARNGRKPDLTSKKVGNQFLYCEECGHQRDTFPEAYTNQCPECLTRSMVLLTVEEEDLK